MNEYPSIGQSVDFIRSDQDGNIMEGTGVVQAIFLNPDKREMVQIKSAEDVYNVDLACVDSTPEKKEQFKAMVEEVQAITNEGNELVRKTVEEYNSKVQEAYGSCLGEPVKID